MEVKRKTGIEPIGDVPWSTHFPQFYHTREDLLDILVPYFKAGLENNEFCMWVTSEPLNEEEAKEAMRKIMPDFDQYLQTGQIEILPYNEWYLKDGLFNSQTVLDGWIDKLNQAMAKGFDGLRLTGNTSWLEKKDWKDFADYERAVHDVIGKNHMISICTYSLDRCDATEVIDMFANHQFALIKKEGKWVTIKSLERKLSDQTLRESESKYRSLFTNMIGGFAYHKILLDDSGKPVDYVFLEVTEVLPGIEKDPADWINVYGKVALTGEEIKFENYAELLDKWYSVSAYSPGKGYFVAVFEDITERKRAEDERKHFASFPKLNPNPVLELDSSGKITFCNDAAYRILEELKLKNANVFLPKNITDILNALEQKNDVQLYREVKIKDRIFGENLSFVPQFNSMRIYATDITDRKSYQEALQNALEESRRHEAEISALLEASSAVLKYPDFNSAARAIFDSCKNLIGATSGYIALLSKDGTENEVLFLDSGGLPCTVDSTLPMPIRGLRGEAFQSVKTVYDNDFAASKWMQFMPEGHVRLDNVIFAPMVIEGKAIGLLGIANKQGGFTENDARLASAFAELAAIALTQKRAGEALRSERQKLINILDSMVDGIYIVNQQYDIEYINPELEKEYGPVNGRRCYEYFEGRKEVCSWCRNQDVFGGKTVRWEWYSTKTKKTYDLINTPLRNPDGSVSKLGIFRDITERTEAERRTREYLDIAVFHHPRDFSRQRFVDFMFAQSVPHEPVVELARALARESRFTLMTLNNESDELNRHRIGKFGLSEVFEAFLSSCWLGVRKPTQRFYSRALAIAQADPAASLFIDDREQNIAPARALGIGAILFTSPDRLRSDLERVLHLELPGA